MNDSTLVAAIRFARELVEKERWKFDVGSSEWNDLDVIDDKLFSALLLVGDHIQKAK